MANRELCTTEEELDEWDNFADLCCDDIGNDEWAAMIDSDDEME